MFTKNADPSHFSSILCKFAFHPVLPMKKTNKPQNRRMAKKCGNHCAVVSQRRAGAPAGKPAGSNKNPNGRLGVRGEKKRKKKKKEDKKAAPFKKKPRVGEKPDPKAQQTAKKPFKKSKKTVQRNNVPHRPIGIAALTAENEDDHQTSACSPPSIQEPPSTMPTTEPPNEIAHVVDPRTNGSNFCANRTHGDGTNSISFKSCGKSCAQSNKSNNPLQMEVTAPANPRETMDTEEHATNTPRKNTAQESNSKEPWTQERMEKRVGVEEPRPFFGTGQHATHQEINNTWNRKPLIQEKMKKRVGSEETRSFSGTGEQIPKPKNACCAAPQSSTTKRKGGSMRVSSLVLSRKKKVSRTRTRNKSNAPKRIKRRNPKKYMEEEWGSSSGDEDDDGGGLNLLQRLKGGGQKKKNKTYCYIFYIGHEKLKVESAHAGCMIVTPPKDHGF
jgi:hypothetical protein